MGEVEMSQCNHTRGTNHMFERMPQRRQEEPQSLNTSSISLTTDSVIHVLNSSHPYFFPCFLCFLLKSCKRVLHSLRCSPLIAFSLGNKDKGKKRREEKWLDKAKKNERHVVLMGRMRLWWTEDNNETSSSSLNTVFQKQTLLSTKVWPTEGN